MTEGPLIMSFRVVNYWGVEPGGAKALINYPQVYVLPILYDVG